MHKDIRFLLVLIIAIGVLVLLQSYECVPVPNTGKLNVNDILLFMNNNVITNNEYMVITEPRKYFGPVDIQRLQIKLFDDHGRILDMNYSDFSFCLNLSFFLI
jgi:hypothetical protein